MRTYKYVTQKQLKAEVLQYLMQVRPSFMVKEYDKQFIDTLLCIHVYVDPRMHKDPGEYSVDVNDISLSWFVKTGQEKIWEAVANYLDLTTYKNLHNTPIPE